jgi:hypothetical protein
MATTNPAPVMWRRSVDVPRRSAPHERTSDSSIELSEGRRAPGFEIQERDARRRSCDDGPAGTVAQDRRWPAAHQVVVRCRAPAQYRPIRYRPNRFRPGHRRLHTGRASRSRCHRNAQGSPRGLVPCSPSARRRTQRVDRGTGADTPGDSTLRWQPAGKRVSRRRSVCGCDGRGVPCRAQGDVADSWQAQAVSTSVDKRGSFG